MLAFSSGWERYDPPSPQFAYNSPSLVSAHAHMPALTALTKEKAAGIYTIPPRRKITSMLAHTSFCITNVGAGMQRSDWCQPIQATDPIISL